MTKQMVVLAAFLAAAGCAHQAVKPGAGAGNAGNAGSGAAAGAESSGAGQGAASGQAVSGNTQSMSHTVHFAFNSSAISGENKQIVKENAQYMQANPTAHVRLEGNTDERGTEEYNLALGWHRAKAVKSMMEVLGVPAARISTISYGKDHPVAMGHDHSAWAQNRRVDFDYNQ